ncbi:hypothetical protein [Mycolicibacterium canariasense]|uniref:hypothetical protein n=1 Tax=Mycolicibacterium canariasense TaxID=228230 RepID=UPI0007EB81D9|nr:hypothetical protein [Mycolicibacterium canariasense]MCV7208762.1 hypothetical protein [Mycolicibacterium canariasense]
MPGHPDSTSTRPVRNGTCKVCTGAVRHYPPPAGVDGPGAWAHLNRADWIDNPHDPDPTDEAIAAAQVPDPAAE